MSSPNRSVVSPGSSNEPAAHANPRDCSRNTLLLAVVLAAGAVLGAPLSLDAQIAVDRGEIQINPMRASERVALISVRNEGAQHIHASVLLEDWDRDELGTNRWYKPGKVTGSCGERVTVFPRALQLAPGERQTVRVVVDSTTRFESECWSAAVVQVAQQGTANGRAAHFNVRTAVKLYVTPPQLERNGEIEAFHVGVDSIDVRYRNTGKVHGVSRGRVEFRRADNSIAATIAMPELYLLPGAARKVRLETPRLAAGRYIVLAIVDFGGDELAAAQADWEKK